MRALVSEKEDGVEVDVKTILDYMESREDILADRIRSAVETLLLAIERYPPPTLALAYNGGKDCTVVLHLTRVALALHSQRRGVAHNISSIRSVHFDTKPIFESVREFVDESRRTYGLSLVEYRGGSVKSLLKEFLETPVDARRSGDGESSEPVNVKAIIMGVRSSDPTGGALRPFTPTTAATGWPDCMRVLPILDWSYSDVWAFLRAFELPYCALYKEGYTSIGSEEDTMPNPELTAGGYGALPAYLLMDTKTERGGRSTEARLKYSED